MNVIKSLALRLKCAQQGNALPRNENSTHRCKMPQLVAALTESLEGIEQEGARAISIWGMNQVFLVGGT